MEWNSRQYLNREACHQFENKLKAMPYKKIWNLQPEEEMPAVTEEMLEAAGKAAVSDIGELEPMNQEYFFVRVSPEGMIHFNGLNETVSAARMEVDGDFFYLKLKQLYKRRNDYFFLGERNYGKLREVFAKPKLSSCTQNDMSLEMRGVLSIQEPYASCQWRLIFSNKEHQAEFLLHKTPVNSGKFGFYCCIGNDRLKSKKDYSARIIFFRDTEPVGECLLNVIKRNR